MPSLLYSQEEKSITEKKIRELVSQVKVKSLTDDEEACVEEHLLARRGRDGKMSLQQVYEVLYTLWRQNKISETDKDGLFKVFQSYLGEGSC